MSARPIRVLLIAPSMEIVGGQAVQAARLLDGFANDPAVSMTFLPMNPRLPGPMRILKRVKYLRTVLTALWFQLLLLARIRQCDILHVFSAGYWSFLLAPAPALLFGRVFGRKVILNYRDGRAEDHLRNWPTARLARLASAIVAPSGYLVDVFARWGLKARAIFNVIDPAQFLYRERHRLRPVFFANRGLEPLYNVGCILRAFAIIQQRYPDATLDIAHDGVSRPSLELLAAELGLRNTRFLGSVPHRKMPELYNAADVYLTSPDLDCMPGSILECFASGLPVVATKAGGIPYIAADGNTALLVDCGDHVALAAAAIRLLEEPGLAGRLVRAAREEVQRYAWSEVRGQWLALYRELISR